VRGVRRSGGVAIENGGCGLSVRPETCVGLGLDMVLTMLSGIRVGDRTRWVGDMRWEVLDVDW
jgi:hypothetical protein